MARNSRGTGTGEKVMMMRSKCVADHNYEAVAVN
jgi:hypothetical protein